MNTEQNENKSDCSFIVEIRDVQKSFGSLHVIRGISLTIENGQVVVICGPSGCGKSTLLRCINGLEPIDSGDIIVGGISVKEKNRLRELRTETGMVFQQFNLFPHKTVLENVMLAPVDIRRMNKSEAKNLARGLLDRVTNKQHSNIKEILKFLREKYCGSIGYEYMHISNPFERKWFRDRVEKTDDFKFTQNGKEAILNKLIQAEGFEKYLHTKYVVRCGLYIVNRELLNVNCYLVVAI